MRYEEWQRKKADLEYEIFLLDSPIIPDSFWENAYEEFTFFSKLLYEAGFVGYLKAIENKYWPKAYLDSQYPWYEHHSKYGILTIGWRKLVISISWNYKVNNKIVKINMNEQVTHGYEHDKGYVHAWTQEKAHEYLKLLYDALQGNYE